jgi:hypothetical protein
MANSDTILAIRGSVTAAATPARNVLASQSGLATAETLLTMGTDAGTNVTAFLPFVGQADIVGRSNPMSINANTAILLDQYGAKAGERGVSAPYFNTGSLNGLSFTFRVQGLLTSSAASNGLTVKVYVNTKAAGAVTAGAGTLATIATGATIGNAVSGTFIAEVGGMWDSTSNLMQGTESWGAACGVYVSRAVGQGTPFTVTAPLSNYLIFASIKFATGAANVITPVELAYEDK